MNATSAPAVSTADRIVLYKTYIAEILKKRPSGTRRRLAQALNTNPSFISQITNPHYRIPIPSQHLRMIIHMLHLSKQEEEEFIDLYRQAHPFEAIVVEQGLANEEEVLVIKVPQFKDANKKREVLALIKNLAETFMRLTKDVET